MTYKILKGLFNPKVIKLEKYEKLKNMELKKLQKIGGIAGILTVYPLYIFTEIFGISQIVWFLWIGVSMIRKPVIVHNQ